MHRKANHGHRSSESIELNGVDQVIRTPLVSFAADFILVPLRNLFRNL